MTRIVRAEQRYRSSHDGIESWHCFAAGAHYDPDNVSLGALVGFDEHHLAPGAGFDWHPHRGVEIVSYVISGALRHQDDRGADRIVRADETFVQSTADGVRHRETNASANEALRVVQMTALTPSDARFEMWRNSAEAVAPLWHVFVVEGMWRIGGAELAPGDSARGADHLAIDGDGVLLVWLL